MTGEEFADYLFAYWQFSLTPDLSVYDGEDKGDIIARHNLCSFLYNHDLSVSLLGKDEAIQNSVKTLTEFFGLSKEFSLDWMTGYTERLLAKNKKANP